MDHPRLELDDFSCSLETPKNFGRLRFGKYPTQDECDVLMPQFNIFVDLTTPEEITWSSEPGGRGYDLPEDVQYYRCPIDDRTPNPRDFSKFRDVIFTIVEALSATGSVYIHCRGGHGRSAMMAAVVLCLINPGLGPEDALVKVREAHSKRKIMEPRWRKMGAPQTTSQINFVYTEIEKLVHGIPLSDFDRNATTTSTTSDRYAKVIWDD